MKSGIVIEAPVAPNANVVFELENMIKNHIAGIQARKDELKKVNEMVESVLVNDPTYKQVEKKAKEISKVKNASKAQLMAIPSNAKIVNKAKDLRAEIKEMNEALSDYASEFVRMTGSDEIEDNSGKRWTFVKRYKICAGQQKLFGGK
jgi:uncharacterized membrane protein YgaE (UPF0421/DUF939 family)